MSDVKYQGIAMGGKIYSLRRAKKMTQEQLAAVLCVSPAAVSKWERNLANPNIEMLWMLADLFECTMDELAGRRAERVEKLGNYDRERMGLAAVGEDLLKCSEISREKGLLAMEEQAAGSESGSRFLAFAVPFILDGFMKQAEPERVFRLLDNYAEALPEPERAEGRMIADVLRAVFAGEGPEIIQEQIASHIGFEYRDKMKCASMGQERKRSRQEILDKYADKKQYSDATDLIEPLAGLGDFEIQAILRNLDNVTLTAALSGASGKVVRKVLANMADRVMYFISEDMDHWKGTEEEILAAQRKVAETGIFSMEEVK